MDKFERLVFVIGMSLVVLGLMVLFEDAQGHSNQYSFQQSAILSSMKGGQADKRKLSGPELPAYDIILFNRGDVSGEQVDLSVSSQQEEMIRLGLRQAGSEVPCDLEGKRPDRVFWGQRSGQKHPDSLSVYSKERLIYLGNYLEAWKIQAQGGFLVCYRLPEQTAKLLMSL
ncbi:hypothetical protein [Kiloniella antarctica]|uniref:Uncharacterized protein n=1 Tax=Kiloniella antarctica TaxID=1550907 RepID=A0ABW5BIK4_9PROT